MSDLLDMIPRVPPPPCVQGTIANAPADAADELYVLIGAFDDVNRFGPCYFAPKAGQLPAEGDPCLVAFDEERQPWVVVWWNGSPAAGGGSGGSANVDATASATTTAPGSAAAVVVTEPTANLFNFAFGIPRGDVGAAGAASTVPGPQGPIGPTGPQGAQGVQGAQGPTGAITDAEARVTLAGTTVNGSFQTLAANSFISQAGDTGAYSIASPFVKVRDAGVYLITAHTGAGGGTTRAYLRLWSNGAVVAEDDQQYPNATVSSTLTTAQAVYLPAGANVNADLYVEGTGRAVTGTLSIARIGQGPQGAAGAQGAQGVQGAQGATGPVAQVSQEGWHVVGAAGEPAYKNGWGRHDPVNYTPEFRKRPDGVVQLRGIIRGGAADTVAFTLPVGYRPDQTLYVTALADTAYAGGGATYMIIGTGGDVAPHNGGGAPQWFSLAETDIDTGQTTFPAGKSVIPVVTALPVGPTDGDEVYFQSAAMATAGVSPWHLRYRAASTSAYKWEVVGATPLSNECVAVASPGNTGGLFTNIPNDATGTKLMALPLSGDYMVEYGISGITVSATIQDIYGAVHRNDNTQLTNGSACEAHAAVANDKHAPRNRTRLNAQAVGIVLDIRGYVAGGGTFQWDHAYIMATPIRLG